MMLRPAFAPRGCARTILFASALVAPLAARADGSSIRFQKPNRPGAAAEIAAANIQFRPAASVASANALRGELPEETALEPAPLRVAAKPLVMSDTAIQPASAAADFEAAKRRAKALERKMTERATVVRRAPQPSFLAEQAEFDEVEPLPAPAPRRAVVQAGHQRRTFVPEILDGHAEQIGYCAGCAEPECGVTDPGCGMEVGCGMAEPECGVVEPGCSIAEPGCGVEPECGFAEPSCGVADPNCGSCVGRGGADYWCFPVCLPRFKELSFWGGVHGFKGPRDATLYGGNNDGNFGFQEGLNVGGRAPLIGLLFPQLGYQVSYQAVQSQLSGNSGGSASDRNQDFVTAGVFRRTAVGLQFGAAWDHMSDDFLQNADFNQIRYEVSLKGQTGREIGFMGMNHVSDDTITTPLGPTTFRTVDQYLGFFRYNFQGGPMGRLWGGATGNGDGIFGGDFYAPLSDRWSLQSGFNYLITDAVNGTAGAREESWNLGMNVVWHFGCTARKSRFNPFMPLFTAADNGTMFVNVPK